MDLDLNLSDEDEIVADDSRPHDDVGDSGVVLVAINALKVDMEKKIAELQKNICDIAKDQAELKSIVARNAAEIGEELRNMKTIVEISSGHESKPKRVSTIQLPHLVYAAGPDRASVPLLTWAIITTVISYVREMPPLRFWVSDAMWSKLAPHAEILQQSQGLAMILFSAKNNSKAKLGTPPGRLWTFLMQRSLRSGIIFARNNLFRKDQSVGSGSPQVPRTDHMGIPTSAVSAPDAARSAVLPREPEWMVHFSKNIDIVRAVEDVFQKYGGCSSDVNLSSAPADSLSEGPSPRSKKRKKGTHGTVDAAHEQRKQAVKQMRSMWMEKMNHGRTAMRAYLYKTLVFILDMLSSFEDADVAASNGYKIVLGLDSSGRETITGQTSCLLGSIWDIPDAYGRGTADADKKNEDLLGRLKSDFSSLHATITYKKKSLQVLLRWIPLLI